MSYYEFTPKTEEELDAMGLIEDGDYDFMTTKSTKKISSSGNPMAVLTITVWDKEGTPHTITDFLVFSNSKFCMRKYKHYCEAVGLEKEYKEGRIPEDLANYGGKVKIGTQDETPKDGGGFYPKKNIVADYIPSTGKPKVTPPVIDEGFDDCIPF